MPIIELSKIHDNLLFRRCEAKPKQSSLWGGRLDCFASLATTGYV
jgi:hypothetical protein